MTGESLTFLDGCTVTEGGSFAGPASTAAHDYWLGLAARRNDGRPRVSDLNLMSLYKVADRLVVKQVIDGGNEFRNRYWGTRVREAFGLDATHKLIHEYYVRGGLDQVLALCRLAVAAPRPLRVVGEARFLGDYTVPMLEAAYLPLYDDAGAPDRLMIALDFSFDVDPDGLK